MILHSSSKIIRNSLSLYNQIISIILISIYSFPSYAKEDNTNTTHKTSIIYKDASRGKRILPLQEVTLEARLTENSQPINTGVSWHVFDPSLNKDGLISLIKKSVGGKESFELFPGEYLISASFGHSGVVKRVKINPKEKQRNHVFVLNAGGLRLHSVYEANSFITDDDLTFSIYANPNKKPIIIADKIKSKTLIRLSAGNYQITSKYGNYNALVSTVIKLEAGKIIDVSIQNKAAKVEFKLVAEEKGEAIADTAWLISTDSGDTVGESIKASPSMILAEGDYIAVARNKDRNYYREFSVVSGKKMLVEIIMRQGRMDKLL
ncbi:hypothetical protein [Candidatus Liberibacter americanus]|uniref:Uncharacterized protein n=1 Tax=Candidatus Liberibacter americanus str. Sao Paulo TaxID=1261131 RepID=U6B7G8_9HYPH|nr:hypothetical protein [Candidatus Liberibacter americanus]AHA27806.1 hypothetical protein lam_444 [Candidatus Liberibacter americanus str. Sao Paulo]EMS36189.1 hypothetical protein G653_03051 [Candidatus Liberibacter americanus PW_SP]